MGSGFESIMVILVALADVLLVAGIAFMFSLSGRIGKLEVLVAGKYIQRDEVEHELEKLEAKVETGFKEITNELKGIASQIEGRRSTDG